MKTLNRLIIGVILLTLNWACFSVKKVEVASQNDSVNTRKVLIESQILFQKGFGFAAYGNEPSFSLEIDFEKVIRFSAQDGFVLNTPPVTGVRAMDADVTFYHATTEAGEIRITISGEKCIDSLSGEESNYLTRIETRYSLENEFRSYNGCGRFIFDYRLHDIWVLKEMTGITLNPEKLTKGSPVFEFNPDNGRFSGNAGCNELNAHIDVRGDKINFGKIISTRMACPDMSFEQTIISKIEGKTFIYKIHEGILTLEDESDFQMTFRKTD